MTEKNRERKYNKENYKKKQREKRRKKGLKEAQAISRRTRNEIRRSIRNYFGGLQKVAGKSLLFVMKDTDNMECVLLQKVPMEKGRTLLALPNINEDMINNFLNDFSHIEPTENSLICFDDVAIGDLVEYYYSVKPGSIMDSPECNMMIFRDCTLTAHRKGLISMIVRPYNLDTWYTGECTSLNAFRIYRSKKLKTFFRIDNIEDYANTFIFHQTLAEILAYRAITKKLEPQVVITDLRGKSKKGFNYEYWLTAVDETKETYERMKSEPQEFDELRKIKKRTTNPYEKRKYVDIEESNK